MSGDTSIACSTAVMRVLKRVKVYIVQAENCVVAVKTEYRSARSRRSSLCLLAIH